MASNRSSSSSLIVKMMILALGATSLIARQASMPLLRGIRTSIRTMSGKASPAFSTASAPSLASPTTSISGSVTRTISRPRRNSAWSSTISVRIGSRLRPVSDAASPSALAVIAYPFAPVADLPPGARQSRAAPAALKIACNQTLSDRARPRKRAVGARRGAAAPALAFPAQPRIRLAATAANLLRPAPGRDPHPHARRRGLGRGGAAGRVLDQPDDAVLIAVPPVDDARRVLIEVVEQVEIVPDKFHLEQRLVDRDRPGMVELLPDYQRPVALHVDLHHALGLRGAVVGGLGLRLIWPSVPGGLSVLGRPHPVGRRRLPRARATALAGTALAGTALAGTALAGTARPGAARPGGALQRGAGSRDSAASGPVVVLPPVECSP